MFTENFETETVNFKAGPAANYIKPGDIVTITDKNKTIKNKGGRASSVNVDGKTIKLDRILDVDQAENTK